MRKSKMLRSLALGLVGVLMCAGVALADNLNVSGDELVAANLDLGTVCADEPADSTVSLAARRNGNVNGSQVWANGATVTFSVASSTGAGLSAAMDATPSQVVLPANWTSLDNNVLSASKTATVTLNTSVTGPFAGTVTFIGSGAGSQPGTVTRDGAINVVAEVEDCTPADTTAPVIVDDGFSSGAVGSNDWYISAVFNEFSASDVGSGLADCASTFVKNSGTAEGAAVKINSGPCSDNAGNTNPGIASIEYKIDLTNPTVTCAATPTFTLNQAGAQVSAAVSDGQSGPAATAVGAAADTSAVGSHTASVTGYDNAGRSTTVSCSYNVHYDFVGFDRPVDNSGIFNVVKAGQGVPLKFRVEDANGNGITGLTAPPVMVTVANKNCDLAVTDDLIEEVAAGQSGLQDLGYGYYNFVWKTPKDYAGSCKKLTLNLGDGNTSHTALFKFIR